MSGCSSTSRPISLHEPTCRHREEDEPSPPAAEAPPSAPFKRTAVPDDGSDVVPKSPLRRDAPRSAWATGGLALALGLACGRIGYDPRAIAGDEPEAGRSAAPGAGLSPDSASTPATPGAPAALAPGPRPDAGPTDARPADAASGVPSPDAAAASPTGAAVTDAAGARPPDATLADATGSPLTDLQALGPLIDCSAVLPGGKIVSVFGNRNYGGRPIAMPLGGNNQFSPAPANRGQPTQFPISNQHYLLLIVHDAYPLIWRLGLSTATASVAVSRCRIVSDASGDFVTRDDGTVMPVPKP
jgi:hypothetical protein